MCKTNQRRATNSPSPAASIPLPPQNTFFPQFFTPEYLQLANFANQISLNATGFPHNFQPASTPATLYNYEPRQQPQQPFSPLHTRFAPTPNNPSFEEQRLRLLNLYQPKLPILQLPALNTKLQDSQETLPQNLESLSLMKSPQQDSGTPSIATSLTKKRPAVPMPQLEETSSSGSLSDSEKPLEIQKRAKTTVNARGNNTPKRKHEATLDGERRVAIEFESMGTLGQFPQTYGKGMLVVPDGVKGKYSAFGQRWRFSIAHAVGPVICEDGVQRMCLRWSITNLNSGVNHSILETPADALKRDRDGKTLCNRVFRDALSLRASSLQADIRECKDSNLIHDLQTQLKTLQTKRFSEGPLFFGLRHLSLQKEMRRQRQLRNDEEKKQENKLVSEVKINSINAS